MSIPAKNLPDKAGVSFKHQHFTDIMTSPLSVPWFEVHTENYMGAGGRMHHELSQLRQNYAISMHGVGLSLGSSERPDQDHMKRIKDLVDRYQPEQVSEHLTWSMHAGQYLNDLIRHSVIPQVFRQVLSALYQAHQAIQSWPPLNSANL